MDENRTVVHGNRLLYTCQSSVILFCCQTMITQKDELPKKVSKESLYTSALAISDFKHSRILTGYRT